MTGITRGLQLMAQLLSLLIVAYDEAPSGPATKALLGIVAIWLEETCAAGSSVVKISAWSLLLGSDPWKGSRAAFQQWLALQTTRDTKGN